MTQPEASSPARGSQAASGNLVDRLERWHLFGAVWRVASRSAGTVTIAFCRCDDGEEVDRLTSDDPNLMDWLEVRKGSEQGGRLTPSVEGHPRC